MNATYAFDVNVPRSLVHITIGGFFEPEDIRQFVVGMGQAHERLRCPPNAHMCLVDIRSMKIQSQDSVAGFAAVLADPTFRSRRIAFVVATSLARSQLKRAAGSRGDNIFPTIDEAERWLFAEDVTAAA